MIDYKTSKCARILFVGINPHPGSYRRGVPFSNKTLDFFIIISYAAADAFLNSKLPPRKTQAFAGTWVPATDPLDFSEA